MALLAPTLLPAANFNEVRPHTLDEAWLEREYTHLEHLFDRAESAADTVRAIRAWDDLRRQWYTWTSMVDLQFQQDTKNEVYKKAAEMLNILRPKAQARSVGIKQRLLAHPHRAALEREIGAYAFERWSSDVAAFDPRIESDVIQESALSDDYTALLAGAEIPFEGSTYTLSGLGKFSEDGNRSLREGAARAKWAFFEEHAEELDSYYDRLVHTRDEMARKLGYGSYVDLGYKRLARTDYSAENVAQYREEIRREIVPLARRIIERQRSHIGVEAVRIWDEGVFYTEGIPEPPASYDAIMHAAKEAFAAMDPALGSFSRLMIDGSLVDLQLRDGKAGGGFCTSFPRYGLPYIFANFNGTTHDVNVLLHEMGHAFQSYESRGKALCDYLSPTYDAAEIHSMSLEFLAWPQLERFFGEDADRYRRQHLASTILFLPYGAAVDHFQHLVYERPDAAPAERHGFWKQLEATYLPWRNNGNVAYLEKGGAWQQQRHIYNSPFYYIDYTLAANCALQFWMFSSDDYGHALRQYTELCKRGGQAPFQSLVRSAGLRSPFEAGVFADIAARASTALGV